MSASLDAEASRQALMYCMRDVLRRRGYSGDTLDAKMRELLRTGPRFKLPDVEEIERWSGHAS